MNNVLTLDLYKANKCILKDVINAVVYASSYK